MLSSWFLIMVNARICTLQIMLCAICEPHGMGPDTGQLTNAVRAGSFFATAVLSGAAHFAGLKCSWAFGLPACGIVDNAFQLGGGWLREKGEQRSEDHAIRLPLCEIG